MCGLGTGVFSAFPLLFLKAAKLCLVSAVGHGRKRVSCCSPGGNRCVLDISLGSGVQKDLLFHCCLVV